jgi:hypothetical protein
MIKKLYVVLLLAYVSAVEGVYIVNNTEHSITVSDLKNGFGQPISKALKNILAQQKYRLHSDAASCCITILKDGNSCYEINITLLRWIHTVCVSDVDGRQKIEFLTDDEVQRHVLKQEATYSCPEQDSPENNCVCM